MTERSDRAERGDWGLALLAAAPVFLFVSGLFYYWFAVANRYEVFLYGHAATGIPGAQPFDAMTSSRYWMAGLVATGAVMVLFTAVSGLVGLVGRWRHVDLRPPVWWKIWLLCAIPLMVVIPLITMTANDPTLPFELASMTAVVATAGLAIALMPGSRAWQRPGDLFWLAFDGLGLMPAMLLLRAIELPGRGLSVTLQVALLFALGGTLAGILWLGAMTCLRARRRKPAPTASALFIAGLGLSYLLMPLVHHLLMTTSSYRYITVASNFFAFDFRLQLAVFAVAAGIAVCVTQLRRKLLPRIAPGTQ